MAAFFIGVNYTRSFLGFDGSLMKLLLMIGSSVLLCACVSAPAVDRSKVKDPVYESFSGRIKFDCAGMTLGLSDFTVDMEDLPLSAGKAKMFYQTDVDIQTRPKFVNGEVQDENFMAGIWVDISLGKGDKRRKLPQEPVYFRQVGHSLSNPPTGFKGGILPFDDVLNPENKIFDIFYDVKCENNQGDKTHRKFRTQGKIYKWPNS